MAPTTILLLALLSFASALDINFYDDDGSVFTLTLKGSACYNFKPKWDKRATSIDIDEGCFTVYQDTHCDGDKTSLAAGNHNLRLLDIAEKLSSVKICNPKEEANAVVPATKAPAADGGDKADMPGGGSPHLQEVWDAAVEEHNKYRRIHGVDDVKGNEEMHKDAQAWADKLAANNEFKSTTMNKYGNNLASSFRRTKVEAVRDAVKRWYDKIKLYDFERPGYNVDGNPTGSFSAIVWKQTTDIGVGIAWDERDEAWIVNVFYSPPALRGNFKENVPPPKNERKRK